MTVLLIIFLYTLILYVMHIFAHRCPFFWYFHDDHHKQVINGTIEGFNWKNIFLIFDNWKSTIDQWLIEVIPTVILSIYFEAFWLLTFYYIWAAFIQESVRHNKNFNLMPFLTSGEYHLKHHYSGTKNYGVFVWFWDWVFGTYDYKKSMDTN